MAGAIGYCQASPSDLYDPTDTLVAKSVLATLGFSPFIIRHAEDLYSMFIISKIHTEIGSAESLLKALKSNWGYHLDPEAVFRSKEILDLGSLIQNLGMHDNIRELVSFSEDPRYNSLMIYLGAHPTILCHSFSEIKTLSKYIRHTLIVASSQEYHRSNYENCGRLQYHAQLLAELPEQSTQKSIMKAYLQGFGFKALSIDTTPAAANPDMNGSERLRRYLEKNRSYLLQFNKIIIVAPQPLGLEAELVVSKYIDKNTTNYYRLFYAPEFNLRDALMAIRSLLQTDIALQKTQ